MKNLWLSINLVLGGLIIYWGWNIVNTWFMPADRLYQSAAAEEKITAPVKSAKKEKKKKVKRKPLRHYAMIGKKTLFRPEREEWEPPPPPPPTKPEPSPPPEKPTPPPPPPPLADPILDGVIILSETNRMALMRGSHREERASTRRSSTRFSRGRRHSRTRPTQTSYKIIKDEAKFYHVGDEISEMIIEQILDEKVVLKRKNSGEKVEVPLRSKEKVARQKVKSIPKKPPTRSIRKRTPRRRPSRFRRRSLRRRTR